MLKCSIASRVSWKQLRKVWLLSCIYTWKITVTKISANKFFCMGDEFWDIRLWSLMFWTWAEKNKKIIKKPTGDNCLTTKPRCLAKNHQYNTSYVIINSRSSSNMSQCSKICNHICSLSQCGQRPFQFVCELFVSFRESFDLMMLSFKSNMKFH